MRIRQNDHLHEDLIVSWLRSQIGILTKILHYIEAGNDINGFVDEGIRGVEKELRSFRKFYVGN